MIGAGTMCRGDPWRKLLPIPLREGSGGRGFTQFAWDFTPPPNPLPQGEGEEFPQPTTESAKEPRGAVPSRPFRNIVQPTRSRLHPYDQSGKRAP